MANGVLGMMRFTGQSLSLALGTLVIGYFALGQCVSQGCTFDPNQYAQALQLAFGVGAVLAAAATAFAFLGREKRPEQQPSYGGADFLPSLTIPLRARKTNPRTTTATPKPMATPS